MLVAFPQLYFSPKALDGIQIWDFTWPVQHLDFLCRQIILTSYWPVTWSMKIEHLRTSIWNFNLSRCTLRYRLQFIVLAGNIEHQYQIQTLNTISSSLENVSQLESCICHHNFFHLGGENLKHVQKITVLNSLEKNILLHCPILTLSGERQPLPF